ncbi:SDR family oxidoreductase [Comamonas aquatica]|uniref:SDR family oxidoreductase n=1 Tax=Comamonas aquatica TaxID=225991 RepID=UPI003D029291
MPPNQFPPRALPGRFRRTRVLIVGCGDVGQRVARQLQAQAGRTGRHGPRVLALTSSPDKRPALQALGITPLLGNLDDARSLRRLRGVAQRVIHLAPPASQGAHDVRTARLLRALGPAPQALVYGSTTGVYGDCGGAWVDETRALQPGTERAGRRVDAEQQLRAWGRRSGARVNVLRIPGIYAPDREGGTPQGRLLKGLPVLRPADDVFTNHIHADDLAQALRAALWRGRPQRVYNVCDHTELRMGDYFDLAAQIYGLPQPARLSRQEAQQALPPMMLSFMSESRRLRNTRMLRELRVRLAWPTVAQGLAAVQGRG